MANNKRLTKFISIFIGIVLSVSLLAGSVKLVYGAASGGNDPIDVPSKPSAGDKVFSKSRGASWVRYPVNGNNNIVIAPQKASGQIALEGGVLHGCVDDGAEYYYRLAYNWYKKGTNTEWYADQTKGVLAVRNLDAAGGTVPVVKPPVWGEGAINYDTALSYFNKTKAAEMNNGLEWNNVGMFCWSEKLLCQPGDPYYPTCIEPAPQTYNAHFWADSTVSADAEHAGTISATSEAEDKKAYITFSTDQQTTNVTFYHNLHYVLDNQPAPAHNSDTWTSASETFTEDVYTDWTVSGAGTGSGKWTLNGITPKSNTDLTEIVKTTVPVTLGLNETKTVCQKIEYNPKYYTFKTVGDHHHTDHSGDTTNPDNSTNHDADKDVHDYWDWGVDTSSGSAYSEACAIIYRPPDSNPDDSYNPGDAGNDDTEKMYAGEETHMEWYTHGESAPTRRLMNWKAILYLVKEGTDYYDGITKGYNRSSDEPCSYYGKKSDNYYCDKYGEGSVNHSDPNNLEEHDYGEYPNLAVADYVGSKFCMSFGYQYAYWYGTSSNYTDSSSFSWVGPYNSYWRDYNAKCKTVAKKPSTAIWNGSLMTSSSVFTPPSAYRHIDSEMNGTWKYTDFSGRSLYGSWTEHLDVVKNNINNHASGSTLALGSMRNGKDFCNSDTNKSNTTLTISNSDCSNLGHSEINNNSAYLTKLTTYLRDDPKIRTDFTYIDHQSSDSVMAQLGENMSGTTIVRHSGDLNITHNITTNKGPYSNIYQIPQVIIFVDGNVNISSNVERIDAWLIVSDAIDTCTAFNDGTTAAHVNAKPTDICSHQLTFNGPVRADNIKLRRSFGANNIHSNLTGSPLPGRMATEKWAPAEIFNLRADTYLWAYAQAGRYDSSYTESYSRELPPRY